MHTYIHVYIHMYINRYMYMYNERVHVHTHLPYTQLGVLWAIWSSSVSFPGPPQVSTADSAHIPPYLESHMTQTYGSCIRGLRLKTNGIPENLVGRILRFIYHVLCTIYSLPCILHAILGPLLGQQHSIPGLLLPVSAGGAGRLHQLHPGLHDGRPHVAVSTNLRGSFLWVSLQVRVSLS